MQFSENWLRQYVNPSMNSEALSHALTMSGLEVEEMSDVTVAFSKVVVAKILSAEKHPDADRLQVCKVDVGLAEPLQIVCGASNARAGLIAPCALVGAELPGISIKQAKVRGVESFGMMCSSKELGLAAEATGLLELPDDAPIGQDIRQFLDLNDKQFIIKLTPNRSDCLSLIGIAREVSAITGASLCLSETKAVAVQQALTKTITVSAPEACPYYAGRYITGVNAQAKTPTWMVRRLERSGIRSISAIVDVTNYVLLEHGQPLHAFDADKLNGSIQVRFAKAQESLQLLNEQTVKLDADMLVIADDNGAIALAGVMGGASTAVSETSTNVFLESAFFTPDTIAGKARRLGLSTDSSYRFERGVDFGNTKHALERATALIIEICGGQVAPITEVVGQLPQRKKVVMRMSRMRSVLGFDVEKSKVAQLFKQLGFNLTEQDDGFEVLAPSYRFDINIEEDLIEEVARLHGYDHIPSIKPEAMLSMLPAKEGELSRQWLREVLVANSYQEVVTYSFIDEAWDRDLHGNANPLHLKNPIASNMSVMRSSLWGGLLEALNYNLNRKQERVRLFEVGNSYAKSANAYAEITKLSGIAYGSIKPEQWAETARDVDFFDVKADIDALTQGQACYQVATHPALHPGQSAQVTLAGKVIGWLGKLHPKFQQQYGLAKGVIMFELDAMALSTVKVPSFEVVPKHPAVRRDLAIVVDEQVAVQKIIDAMLATQMPMLKEVALFDVYRGKNLGENKKSLAFLVVMQDTQKTLTDNESDEIMAKLLAVVESKFNAVLRQ